MKIQIGNVANDVNITEYIEVLKKYNFNIDTEMIEINTLEELINLSKELKHNIILTTILTPYPPYLTIYDDYIE